MLNSLLTTETQRIITAIGEENIRFVGGCVRDLIAGSKLSDIDFATSLTPDEIIESLDKAGIRYIATGIQHGSITAIYNKNTYDITSLRRDIETDGRHAKIQYIDDWETDAERRDFTLNALYLDAHGKLYDYFGGIDHLRGGKVVFIGDADRRIREDYLRILRYFRFLGRFGKGGPDDQIARICARHAPSLNKLSGERIHSEMRKIILMQNAVEVLENMQNYGILNYVLPGDLDFKVLSNLIKLEKKPDFIRRLAAIAGYNIDELAGRWKFSSADLKNLKLITQATDFTNPRIALRRLGPERFIDTVLLTAAEGKLNYNIEEMVEFAENWQIPKFPIVGKDVLSLGVSEGKAIGQILMKLEHYWESNNFHYSRDELLKRLKYEADEYLKREGKEQKTAAPIVAIEEPAKIINTRQPAEIKPIGPKVQPKLVPVPQPISEEF